MNTENVKNPVERAWVNISMLPKDKEEIRESARRQNRNISNYLLTLYKRFKDR